MIFADTSAIFALINHRDEFHSAAIEWFKKKRPKLVLTDYKVDEVLSLVISRGNKEFALMISKKTETWLVSKRLPKRIFIRLGKYLINTRINPEA